jgi:TolB-like protein
VLIERLTGRSGVKTFLGLHVRGWRDRLFAGSPKPQIQALAVLPLANLSGDPEQEYFADGMTEALITELGKISSPRVISRQSVMQYKGSKKSLQEIAGELKVDAVLEGAVERSGDRVRVTMHLSQALPERQLWAQEYNRSIRDALSLQGEIARAISDEIQVKLTPEERTRLAVSRSVDPEAQDDYLRGLYFANKFTELGLRTAIAQFKTAIEKDPTYAPAYAELALAYLSFGNPWHGGPSPRETMPQAKAAVTRALQLDPSLARGHRALADILVNSGWNWSGAEKEYRIALNLNPNCGECHFAYSALLTALGRSDEAIAQINQAIELDPLSDDYRGWLAEIAYFSRQYDLSIKLFENLSDDWAVGFGTCYAMKKMYSEAIAKSEKGIARIGRQTIHLGYLALVYGLAGRKSETQKIISELKERSRHHYVFPSVFAYAYLGLGDRDQALTFLERAYEEQDPGLFLLNVSPLLDPLRSEPRFQALLRCMNFPP